MDRMEQIKQRMQECRLNQKELAALIGIPCQELSSIFRGQRKMPMKVSLKMDDVLGFELGSTARLQLEEDLVRLQGEILLREQKKRKIVSRIKENGGFWSYQGIPEHLSDDDVIEAALGHLELEEMDVLYQLWSPRKVRQVWQERMLSQGSRLNILNFILAVIFFRVKNPDAYLKKYGPKN